MQKDTFIYAKELFFAQVDVSVAEMCAKVVRVAFVSLVQIIRRTVMQCSVGGYLDLTVNFVVICSD